MALEIKQHLGVQLTFILFYIRWVCQVQMRQGVSFWHSATQASQYLTEEQEMFFQVSGSPSPVTHRDVVSGAEWLLSNGILLWLKRQ